MYVLDRRACIAAHTGGWSSLKGGKQQPLALKVYLCNLSLGVLTGRGQSVHATQKYISSEHTFLVLGNSAVEPRGNRRRPAE